MTVVMRSYRSCAARVPRCWDNKGIQGGGDLRRRIYFA
jgi:hypothetical protein